jgi:hypothetical protein
VPLQTSALHARPRPASARTPPPLRQAPRRARPPPPVRHRSASELALARHGATHTATRHNVLPRSRLAPVARHRQAQARSRTRHSHGGASRQPRSAAAQEPQTAAARAVECARPEPGADEQWSTADPPTTCTPPWTWSWSTEGLKTTEGVIPPPPSGASAPRRTQPSAARQASCKL